MVDFERVLSFIKDKVFWFAVEQREFLDIALVLSTIGVCCFIALVVKTENTDGLYACSSYIIFIIIFIFSSYLGSKHIKFDMNFVCPVKAAPEVELTSRGFFKIEYKSNIEAILSFVYYYITTYARSVLFMIVVYIIMYVITIAVRTEWLGFKEYKSYGFLFFITDYPSSNSIFEAIRRYGIFGKIIKYAIFLPLRVIIIIGDYIWYYLFQVERISWLMQPQKFIEFFDFKTRMADVSKHLVLFVLGIVLAVTYAAVFIKPMTEQQMCEDDGTNQEKMQRRFTHGYFIVCALVIVMYVFDLFFNMSSKFISSVWSKITN